MVCLQCTLKAILEGQTPQWIEDTPEEHMRKVHPDPELTQMERVRLEAQYRQRLQERSS